MPEIKRSSVVGTGLPSANSGLLSAWLMKEDGSRSGLHRGFVYRYPHAPVTLSRGQTRRTVPDQVASPACSRSCVGDLRPESRRVATSWPTPGGELPRPVPGRCDHPSRSLAERARLAFVKLP